MDNLLHYLNQSPTVFFILKKDVNWRLEYVTNNVLDIYGNKAKEFLDNKIRHEDFVHKDDLSEFLTQRTQVSKTSNDEFIYKPYRIVKNNQIIWVSHVTKIIRNEKGELSHYYGYITDITAEKELYNQLELTENILDTIFNNSFNSIVLLDRDSKILKINDTSLKILNQKESNIIGKKLSSLSWWKDSCKENIDLEISMASKGTNLQNKKTFIDSNEEEIYVDFSYTPIFNDNNEVIYIACEGHNITQAELTRKSLEQYVKIVNENILISIADKDGFIIDLSDAYSKFTGYSKKELIGKKHNIFKHPENDDYIFRELWETILKGRIWKGEHQNVKKDGSMFWVENSITPNVDDDGNIVGFTSIYNDITDKKEISKLLITDYLTKIYNRRHFNTTFDIELKRNKRDSKNIIFMILDIDYFKQYNDTYGHDAGDKALHEVAQALKYTLKRSHDFVFRLGGEEFGIITSGVDIGGIEVLAKNLRESIEHLEIEHKENKVNDFLTISIGVKVVESTSTLSQKEIYQLADKALYKAKNQGRNTAIICKEREETF
ncbi:sensor domain-containing diguanylate cyclase [Poseidonibacter lekithochrous]|uniref:sensor domain-containing diguanylate cyclase n=1 Tax=Poseidonibacter lekithochrous TaxID=1904463 RepID=UPI0008FCA696|nr:sensor domain-containing diguanylate cyclase [Poseidonibacter lekithochrous]QKJ23153.1 PAS sensor-containing diguanylate cyclase [Poseidonibacter lekithochrous]